MQAFSESPAENSLAGTRRNPSVRPARWKGVVLAIAVAVVVVAIVVFFR